MKRRNNKESLELLADEFGYKSGLHLIDHYAMELVQPRYQMLSLIPAICVSLDCVEYSEELEPDCDGGFCNYCGEQSMVSCMVLAGVI